VHARGAGHTRRHTHAHADTNTPQPRTRPQIFAVASSLSLSVFLSRSHSAASETSETAAAEAADGACMRPTDRQAVAPSRPDHSVVGRHHHSAFNHSDRRDARNGACRLATTRCEQTAPLPTHARSLLVAVAVAADARADKNLQRPLFRRYLPSRPQAATCPPPPIARNGAQPPSFVKTTAARSYVDRVGDLRPPRRCVAVHGGAGDERTCGAGSVPIHRRAFSTARKLHGHRLRPIDTCCITNVQSGARPPAPHHFAPHGCHDSHRVTE
jgi:hypothetical protein